MSFRPLRQSLPGISYEDTIHTATKMLSYVANETNPAPSSPTSDCTQSAKLLLRSSAVSISFVFGVGRRGFHQYKLHLT
jgi:hypothetical protein